MYLTKQWKKNKKAKASFQFDKVSPVSFSSVMRNGINAQALPVIGGIAVPDLGINLPIFKGVANENLAYGAGTMKADQKMGQGNYALASHNVTGFNSDLHLLFTPLLKAKEGMLIYVTDKEKVYQYHVTHILKVTPDHTEVIQDHAGKKEITLVTCSDSKGTQRVIVQGELDKGVKFSSRNKKMDDALSKQYNQIL